MPQDDELDDVRGALERAPRLEPTPGLKRSAVAAMITPGRQLWFMRRAESRTDPWSGHLSFPGGREEPEDESLLHTAIREVREEVGVDLSTAELLGQLDELRTRPIRTLLIRAFVFRLDHVPDFQLNYEVRTMHHLSLDALLASEGRGTMRWPTRGLGITLPAVDFDGVRLWGLTLQLVDDLLHRLDGRGQGLERSIR